MSIKMLSLLIFLGFLMTSQAADGNFVLRNQYIQVTIANGKPISLARVDGSDSLTIQDDVFEIMLFDKSRFIASDYDLIGCDHTSTTATMTYKAKKSGAPSQVTVVYQMAKGPYLFKDVSLSMNKGEKIDRLQVLRFSTASAASRGGHGQSVFIDKWFFGLNYPCFYSRHSSGFKEPDFHYTYHYTINLQGGDKEFAPREGLVTLFHFPGYARKQVDGKWSIEGKRAVIGIAADKKLNAEIGLLEYIEAYRKPTRSYTHFNNWYTGGAKHITVKDFVNNYARKIKGRLAQYGARFDAMVPDNGWQNKTNFKSIYEMSSKHDPLGDVSKALRAMDIDFGIWIAIDGTTYKTELGEKVGYKKAFPDGHKFTTGRWGKSFFDILDPKYQADYKKNIGRMIRETDLRYVKHDFNHMFSTSCLTERHGREACLDVTLELIDYERKLAPKLLVNYTNGTFFSPFFLLEFEYIWMNSGDSGSGGSWPQLCKSENATSYRDSHFYQSFNNPKRVIRPVIPIANFMTHGILHSGGKTYYKVGSDPIHDWMNYVVMYYSRGTLLKELYIDPDELTEDQWKGLGTATAWAQQAESRMKNTVLIGGDCCKGEVYGYVSWNGDKGFLGIRNPDRRKQTLTVPFDQTVYYRGETGKPFHARAIYPFVEEMPWKLSSGAQFTVDVPGDTVLVYYLDSGAPKAAKEATPAPLAAARSTLKKDAFELMVQVPNEEFKRFDLLITDYHSEKKTYMRKKKKRSAFVFPVPQLMIDGRKVTSDRSSNGSGWELTSFDLRKYRGKTITIQGRFHAIEGIKKGTTTMDAWLIVDRKATVPVPKISADEKLPWAVLQNYRRLTQKLIARHGLSIANVMGQN